TCTAARPCTPAVASPAGCAARAGGTPSASTSACCICRRPSPRPGPYSKSRPSAPPTPARAPPTSCTTPPGPGSPRSAYNNEAMSLLDRLIAAHRPGHALAREFQTDPEIYRLDLERIWRRGWLFAGHTCEVKRPGDYFVFDLDTDSIVVIRGDDGQIHALH